MDLAGNLICLNPQSACCWIVCAKAAFYVSGTTNPGGITVNSTTFVSNSEVDAQTGGLVKLTTRKE